MSLYVRIQESAVAPEDFQAVRRLLEDEFLPALQQRPGLVRAEVLLNASEEAGAAGVYLTAPPTNLVRAKLITWWESFDDINAAEQSPEILPYLMQLLSYVKEPPVASVFESPTIDRS